MSDIPDDSGICQRIKSELCSYLDSECDPLRREEIEKHLFECPDCRVEHDIDKEIRVLVARCCPAKPVPAEFRQKLRALLKCPAQSETGKLSES